jgi:hypothetical protein
MLDADEGYFFLNPAILQKLRPQVWGDLTATDAGLLLSVASGFNVYAITGNAIPTSPAFGAVPASATPALGEELLRIGVSLPLGSLGLGVSAFAGYTTLGDTTTGATQDHHNAFIGLNAGVLVPFSQTLSLDAAAGANYWNIYRSNNGVSAYLASTFDLTALARLNWTLMQNNVLHIFGQFNSWDRGYVLGTAALAKDVTTSLMAGLADEMRITEAILVFAGAYGAAGFHTTAADEVDSYSLYANGGLEAGFTKELTARLGISKNFYNVNYTQSTHVTTSSDGATTLFAGLGVNLGDLALDSRLGIPLLIGGPNFISGTVSALSVVLSGTYYLGAAKAK